MVLGGDAGPDAFPRHLHSEVGRVRHEIAPHGAKLQLNLPACLLEETIALRRRGLLDPRLFPRDFPLAPLPQRVELAWELLQLRVDPVTAAAASFLAAAVTSSVRIWVSRSPVPANRLRKRPAGARDGE